MNTLETTPVPFPVQRLLDEAAVLACSVYVDLNPILAGVAQTPETSEFTSAYERIQVHGSRPGSPPPTGRGRACRPRPATAGSAPWNCKWSARGAADGAAAEAGASGVQQGFLPLPLEQYLALLDWTGRQARRDKRGQIPAELSPILERLQLSGETWVETVLNFGRWFHRAVGRADSLAAEAGVVAVSGCRV